MKKLLTIIAVITAGLLTSAQAEAAGSVKIVAVVNGDIISSQDITNRVNAFVLSTRIPLNAQTRGMINARVLQTTIDEKLKLQDAAKQGIEVSEEDINRSIAGFEKNNKIPQGKLRNILKKAGVSYDSYREQLKTDLGWVRLVRRQMAGETLTQKEIEQTLDNAKKDLNTPKYMVSEIFIRKENAKDIQNLVKNLRQDPRFELYAMQFSESASASSGGKLGWVNKGKLASPLEKALQKMKPGDISNPILVGDGYYILRLEQTFDPAKDKTEMPTEEDIRKYLENQRLEEFAKKHLQELRQRAVIELRN